MLREIMPDGNVGIANQPHNLSASRIREIIYSSLNRADYEFTWLQSADQPYHGVFSSDTGDIDLLIYAWNITPADRQNSSEKRIQIRNNVNDIGFNRNISSTQKTLLLGIYNSAAGDPLIVAWDPAPNRNHRQKSCYVQIEDIAKALPLGIFSTKDKNGYPIYTMSCDYLCSYVNLLQENNHLRSIRQTNKPGSQIRKKEQASRKRRTISAIERLQNKIKNLDERERRAITKVRIGQGYFKEILLSKYSCKCALCNIRTESLLIASHIKPWSESTDNEKLDTNNGLLLCAHHDALFDKNLISFEDNGDIIISPTLSIEEIETLNIASIGQLTVTSEMIPYLGHHRHKLRR